MDIIGLSQEEQTSIFRVLATILWIGNVQFAEGDDGNAAIVDPGVTDFAAYLMNTDSAAIQKVLMTRIMETQRGGRRGELRDLYELTLQVRSTRCPSTYPRRSLAVTRLPRPSTTTCSIGSSRASTYP